MDDRPQDLASDADGPFQSIINRHGRQFRTVGDMVYGVLRESILKGVFAPGEHLRQDRLAEAIGVSRIPVRSALMQLETEGLITLHPYRGAVVNALTADEMREIYEIRELLESHAIRKAAEAATDERLAALEARGHALNAIEDPEQYLQERTRFYCDLYDSERNPQLVKLIEKLRVESGRYWLEHRASSVLKPGEREHHLVPELLRRGEVERAVEWMREHLRTLGRELVLLMEAEARRR